MASPTPIKDPNASEETSVYHVPVLLAETLDGLQIKADGLYVDCTFGGGGHSRAILAALGEKGRLVVFDQDEAARRNLPNDSRVLFIRQNFRHLQKFLRLEKITAVDGVLADLGVSSHQFDEADRGFSTRFDADLDMRMDKRQETTAASLLKKYSALQLQKIFEKYGEVTNAKTLATKIVAARQLGELDTVSRFKTAVYDEVKGNPHKYFAQVFQALRIEVNDEMGALQEMMEQATTLLKPGGRLAIISFHSLEDRMVKNFFRFGSTAEPGEKDVYGNKPETDLLLVNKKPITATAAEMKNNNRSRSAKLRVAEKKPGTTAQ